MAAKDVNRQTLEAEAGRWEVMQVLNQWARDIAQEVASLRKQPGATRCPQELLRIAAGIGLSKGLMWALISPAQARKWLLGSGLNVGMGQDLLLALQQAKGPSGLCLEVAEGQPVLALDDEAIECSAN